MLFFLLITGIIASASSSLPKFGTNLGSNNGVIGYSCYNSENELSTYNYVNWSYAGLKWQCVEYARRWLITTRSLTFGSIPCASDIWHLDSVDSIYSFFPYSFSSPLNRVPNGSRCAPIVGSVLIYGRVQENPVGHVAIIVKVTEDFIHVAEQNWDNDYWPGNYARKIPLRHTDDRYTIEDELPILGWMVYDDYDSECFDTLCETCSERNEDSKIGCTFS